MTLFYKSLAEIAGTFAMIFVGAGSILLSERYPQTVSAHWIPLAWGGTIALMIFAMGRISGAHFNPAVTLAFVAADRFPVNQIPLYWGSQFFGGFMAVSLLKAIGR